MLSNGDLERLIAAKKREILKEKSVLGLSPPPEPRASLESNKENTPPPSPPAVDQKRVTFVDQNVEDVDDGPRAADGISQARNDDTIAPDLERYIRRYLGLPVMLKAGEYSPNNPLLKGETPRDRDAFIGLGDYERRSKTLRRLRQQEYRQYLDQQAKRKQEERQQAQREASERERRERERDELLRERERQRERALRLRERERELAQEKDKQAYYTGRLEKSSKLIQDGGSGARVERVPGGAATVEAGVQVGQASRPLSVAVQTDPAQFYTLKHRQPASQPAERELSPRTGVEPAPRHPAAAPTAPTAPAAAPTAPAAAPAASCDERPIRSHAEQSTREARPGPEPAPAPAPAPAPRGDRPVVEPVYRGGASSYDERPIHPAPWINESRRRSYGDYDERTCALSTNCNRNLPTPAPRQTYMPSIFDEDAIMRRNDKAEKEAAERRLFYQKELKNQIEEQQRIREERKAREKMLELAEMRRLEEQLKMLRLAQDKESARNEQIARAMKENSKQYESKRTALQKEIDAEQKSFFRAITQPAHMIKRTIHTSKSENAVPLSCKLSDLDKIDRKPFSTNIPENSIFSQSYDVDNYLRLNLNPSKESLLSNRMGYTSSNKKENISDEIGNRRFSFGPEYVDENGDAKQTVVEKALVHEEPKLSRLTEKSDQNHTVKTSSDSSKKTQEKSVYEPSFLKRDSQKLMQQSPLDVIPVLRHSPKIVLSDDDKIYKAQKESDAIKRLEGKWAVPAVQKNILKSLPSGDGKNVSILTQLGSIRRQLQMEQLKLDKMLSKDSDV